VGMVNVTVPDAAPVVLRRAMAAVFAAVLFAKRPIQSFDVGAEIADQVTLIPLPARTVVAPTVSLVAARVVVVDVVVDDVVVVAGGLVVVVVDVVVDVVVEVVVVAGGLVVVVVDVVVVVALVVVVVDVVVVVGDVEPFCAAIQAKVLRARVPLVVPLSVLRVSVG
jgi:hypothetical protein